MENYIFLSSNFSISSLDSRESIISSPLKSEKSQLLLLESQITLNNESKVNTNLDVSILKDDNDKKLSQNKSASIENDSQVKVVKPSNAKCKRTFKRCQTTLNITPSLTKSQSTKNEKYFVKKNNHIIEKSFERLRIQKSTFTVEFVPNMKKNLKPVQVRYFRSNYTKVLVIEEDMLAVEFLVLALNQYKNDVKFDQSLYQYPNFTLAYQLEGQDDQQDAVDNGYRKPLQRTKSFGSMDGMRSRRISYGEQIDFDQRPISQAEMPLSQDDIDDRIIQIDVQAEMRDYRTVDLVLITDEKQIHINLDQVKIAHDNEPDKILICVEDPTKSFYHIKVKPDDLIENVFDALKTKSHKYPKSDYYLYLKYQCVHFSQDPLNFRMPIHKLPIHYLVLASKFVSLNTRQPTFLTDSLTLNQNKETIFSKSANRSYRFLQDEGKNYDYADKYSKMYSYQEYQIIKFDDNKYKNPVRLGVDYFDIYYTYVQERQRQLTVNKVCKSLAKLLFEGEITEKDYRRIPINKIISIEKPKVYLMKIIYEKSQNYWKELLFGIDMSQEKVTLELEQKILQNAFEKIQGLVKIRLPKQNKQHL